MLLEICLTNVIIRISNEDLIFFVNRCSRWLQWHHFCLWTNLIWQNTYYGGEIFFSQNVLTMVSMPVKFNFLGLIRYIYFFLMNKLVFLKVVDQRIFSFMKRVLNIKIKDKLYKMHFCKYDHNHKKIFL